MTDHSPFTSAADVTSDPKMRYFREYVAAAIAGIIIIGTFILLVFSLFALDNAENFNRVKDLLLIVNPFMGVVIGYYFNKVSTEARAESAEMTAQSAAATAREATEARNQAVANAAQSQVQTQETLGALNEMYTAAQKMLEQTGNGAATGVLGGSGTPVVDQEAYVALRMAMARAQRVMSQ